MAAAAFRFMDNPTKDMYSKDTTGALDQPALGQRRRARQQRHRPTGLLPDVRGRRAPAHRRPAGGGRRILDAKALQIFFLANARLFTVSTNFRRRATPRGSGTPRSSGAARMNGQHHAGLGRRSVCSVPGACAPCRAPASDPLISLIVRPPQHIEARGPRRGGRASVEMARRPGKRAASPGCGAPRSTAAG